MSAAAQHNNLHSKQICWMNGELVSAENAKVSVFDHGLLYGDGVFEGIRFYNKTAFAANLHLDRLIASAHTIGLHTQFSREQMRQSIHDTIQASGLKEGYIRLLITRGVGPLGINPAQCNAPQTLILIDELSLVDSEKYEAGIHLIIAGRVKRMTGSGVDARVKSLNYLHNVLAKAEANERNADDAVLLNQNHTIAECSAANLFIVKDGTVYTPPVTDGALAGITRHFVLKLCHQLGISYDDTRSLTPYDIYHCDECWLTGTGAKLIPVKSIESHTIKRCPGELFTHLKEAYDAFVLQSVQS